MIESGMAMCIVEKIHLIWYDKNISGFRVINTTKSLPVFDP